MSTIVGHDSREKWQCDSNVLTYYMTEWEINDSPMLLVIQDRIFIDERVGGCAGVFRD